ncbi:MAG TPA: hypothetical protein VGP09_16845 [Caballeronia sp.]|nr:hypothetical protein [Caballeronia sp.]
MNGRRACQLLLVLATLGASGAATAGGYYHGGGGGYHGGGYYHGRGYYHGGCCSGSIGVYLGPGFVGGYPYPYPYYSGYYPGYYPYAPVPVGDVALPTQYVEQGQQADMAGNGPPQAASWYYCRKPDGYYPYVKACPAGWQKVPAQPPGG